MPSGLRAQRLTLATVALKQRQLSQLLDQHGAPTWPTWHGPPRRNEWSSGPKLAWAPELSWQLRPPDAHEWRMQASWQSSASVSDAAEDTWCPKCESVLDRFSHHAASCVARGERTLRHHAIHDPVFARAQRAGLHPERERQGLLLPQSAEDMRAGGWRRRPADLYMPAWLGSLVAFDFAVTAPQRQATLAQASMQAGSAGEALCPSQGGPPWHSSGLRGARCPVRAIGC